MNPILLSFLLTKVLSFSFIPSNLCVHGIITLLWSEMIISKEDRERKKKNENLILFDSAANLSIFYLSLQD